MESFYQAIGLGVISGRGVELDAQQGGHGPPDLGSELGSSVRRQVFGDSKPCHPVLVKCLRDRDSLHVFNGNDLWPTGKSIHHGQQVLEALGLRKWSYQVNMDVVKPVGGWLEVL